MPDWHGREEKMARIEIPDTFTAGSPLAATTLNTYLKDNLTSIDGGYGCKVSTSTAQAVVTSTQTPLTFDAEIFDDDTFHDNSTNPSRITVTEAGRYFVSGFATFAASSTGMREISIRVNGTASKYATSNSNSASLVTYLNISDILVLTAGQYVELYCYHTKGSDLNVTGRSLSVTKYI
jgi:hypothetical protein